MKHISLGFMLLVIIMLLTACGETEKTSSDSAENTEKIKVTVEAKNDINKEKGYFILKGDTNLPSKTKMLIEVTNEYGYKQEKEVTTGENGEFKSKPFTNKKKPLISGEYTIKISSAPAGFQEEEVQKIIGSQGENLTGNLVIEAGTGNNIVEYTKTTTLNITDPNKPIHLKSGEFVVGENIQPGKYTVSTTDEVGGNFVIYRGNEIEVNEILGTKLKPPLMVSEINVELKKGDKIVISDLKKTTFTPGHKEGIFNPQSGESISDLHS